MEELNFVFRTLAFSQVLLFVVVIALRERHAHGLVLALTGVAYCCYLMLPFSGAWPSAATLAASVLANLIPSLLWLVVYRWFQDGHDVPLWWVAVSIAYVTAMCIPVEAHSNTWGSMQFILLRVLPALIKLALLVHLVVMTIRGEDADLIAGRVRLRRPLALGASALAASVVVVELAAAYRIPLPLEALGSVIMFALALAANVVLFSLRLEFDQRSPAYSEPFQDNSAASTLKEQVLAQMERERFYATHSATLADLATKMNVSVHRLRETINQELGYANFNQFLNHYRIAEAAERLRSETVPVTTIALDVGFRSLSSFNAGFKRAHKMTPTQYRAQSD